MAYRKFQSIRLSRSSLEMIDRVNEILAEYTAQGFRLSLRQLYYQLVARGMVENTIRSYKRVGNIVSDGRLCGLIDWDSIEDRGRETHKLSTWKDPAQIALAAYNSFRIDKWETQTAHVEVMVEKDALSGVLQPICDELQVALTANKGYSSSSALYEAGQRLYRKGRDEGKDIYLLYLGDHDPSGIDMTRDVRERLMMFSQLDWIEVERLALNMDQVDALNPPENPAKTSDSRYHAYMVEFGDKSWELDAVEPAALAELVRDFVAGVRDDDLWQEALDKEESMRSELYEFSQQYKNKEDHA